MKCGSGITTNQGTVRLIDGGYSANNPTLFAIADAVNAKQIPREEISVLSLGCWNFLTVDILFIYVCSCNCQLHGCFKRRSEQM